MLSNNPNPNHCISQMLLNTSVYFGKTFKPINTHKYQTKLNLNSSFEEVKTK